MSDTEETPNQEIKRMPDDQPDIGPFYPSGMSGPEAALSGATKDLTDEQVEALKAQVEGTATPSEAPSE